MDVTLWSQVTRSYCITVYCNVIRLKKNFIGMTPWLQGMFILLVCHCVYCQTFFRGAQNYVKTMMSWSNSVIRVQS